MQDKIAVVNIYTFNYLFSIVYSDTKTPCQENLLSK